MSEQTALQQIISAETAEALLADLDDLGDEPGYWDLTLQFNDEHVPALREELEAIVDDE